MEETLNSFINFFFNGSKAEVLAIISLFLSAYAAVISTRAFQRSKFSEKRGAGKGSDRVQELSVKVSDLANRAQSSAVIIKQHTQRIEQKVDAIEALEKQVALLSENADLKLEFDSGSPFERRLQEVEKAILDISLGKEVELTDSTINLNPAELNGEIELEEKPEEEAISLHKLLEASRKELREKLEKLLASDTKKEKALKSLKDFCLGSAFGARSSEVLIPKMEELVEEKKSLKDSIPIIRETLTSVLKGNRPAPIEPQKVNGKPKIILVIGAHSSGKEHYAARLAAQFVAQDARVLLAPCDRESLAQNKDESLEALAQALELDFVKEPKEVKAKTVAYKAIHRAQDEGYDVVIVDAFANLSKGSQELDEIVAMISREQSSAPHEIILALDASVGELAIAQGKEIIEFITPSGVCVTKLNQAERAGIVLALRAELGLPIRYLSVGPRTNDVLVFSEQEFSEALLLEHSSSGWTL